MKTFGLIVLIVGLLGCIWAGFLGTMTSGEGGGNAIAIAIAAVGVVCAGIKLMER